MTDERVPAAAPSRRSFLVPTLATMLAVALFVSAGLWQRDRMQQKQALRAVLDAAAAQAPAALPAPDDWTAWRFRPVRVTGTFDAAHQVLIDNRVHGGRVGYDVVTPLTLADQVMAQARLVVMLFGDVTLALVAGWSLGAMQSEWGHCAGGPGREPAAMAQLWQGLRDLLAR